MMRCMKMLMMVMTIRTMMADHNEDDSGLSKSPMTSRMMMTMVVMMTMMMTLMMMMMVTVMVMTTTMMMMMTMTITMTTTIDCVLCSNAFDEHRSCPLHDSSCDGNTTVGKAEATSACN